MLILNDFEGEKHISVGEESSTAAIELSTVPVVGAARGGHDDIESSHPGHIDDNDDSFHRERESGHLFTALGDGREGRRFDVDSRDQIRQTSDLC
jgi:hypothetical protein